MNHAPPPAQNSTWIAACDVQGLDTVQSLSAMRDTAPALKTFVVFIMFRPARVFARGR